MKLFSVLVAFLAVQGWASAATIPEIPDDLLALIDSVDFPDLEIFGQIPPADEFYAASTPEKCIPYVPKAYDNALQIHALIQNGSELAGKLVEGFKKCKALSSPDEKKQCFEELKKNAIAQGKPLKDAYMKLRPQVIEMMNTFDKCMAGQTVEGNLPAAAEKCLPHIQQAYDTAVELRGIIRKAKELAMKMKEAVKTCKALTNVEQKKACFAELKKSAIAQGKPLKDAYMKVRPQIFDVMDKFSKCLA